MATTWRTARSLDKLRAQINALWPVRDKSSDGTIGDTAHQATKSEHNPEDHDNNPATPGVVRAMDITHDPDHGVDAQKIVDSLVASKDPRILYLIFNGRMWRSYAKPNIRPWVPAPYTGSNSHAHHFHISVVDDAALFDSEAAWLLPGGSAPLPRPKPQPAPSRPAPTVPPSPPAAQPGSTAGQATGGAGALGGAAAVGKGIESGNAWLIVGGLAIVALGVVIFIMSRRK
jgi:LPXTG-motif cell wall-anchored protein